MFTVCLRNMECIHYLTYFYKTSVSPSAATKNQQILNLLILYYVFFNNEQKPVKANVK